jgi:hypothetical protein
MRIEFWYDHDADSRAWLSEIPNISPDQKLALDRAEARTSMSDLKSGLRL